MKRLIGIIGAAMLTIGASAMIASADVRKIDAIVGVWNGAGVVFEVGGHRAYFVGAISGTVFADDEKGVLRDADFVCPGTMYVAIGDGAQTGRGHCAFAMPSGDRLFADWVCEGRRGVGCGGTLTITGGTGARGGSKGEGTFEIRGSLDSLVGAAVGGPAVKGIELQAAQGLIFIVDLEIGTAP